MKDFPQLQSQRLVLRRIVEDDLENIYKGLSHPNVIQYYGVNYKTLDETWEQLEWYAELERTYKGIWWAITSVENRIFYGATGFNNLSKEHRKAELGFWLLPEFQKRGIIQEAVPLIMEYAFQNLDLHRIEAFVETENVNSAKALRNLEFQHEGTMRDCEVKNGHFISLDIFSWLKKE